MDHSVLTRACYDADYPLDANRRRLRLLAGVTAASLAGQTNRNWTWVVALHARDPLLSGRVAAIESAGVPCRFLYLDPNHPPEPLPIPYAPYQDTFTDARRTAYRMLELVHALFHMAPGLQTRLDDDDALAIDTLERVRGAADSQTGPNRLFWVHPNGFRIWRGRYESFPHPRNMMSSMQTWHPDHASIYDFSHISVQHHGEVREIDDRPAWLWVRHQDSVSVDRGGLRSIAEIRDLFTIDWSLLLSLSPKRP